MAAEIHVGDAGTEFLVTVKDEEGAVIDVSAATTREVWFRKPDGQTVLTRTATLYTDGTDGVIRYVLQAGDFDTAGKWKLQGYVVVGAAVIHTEIHDFRVFANLQ